MLDSHGITLIKVLACTVIAITGVAAQESAMSDSAKAERLMLMKSQAASFTGTVGGQSKIKVIEEPLLRWSNPHTNIQDGVLVGWVDDAGVPVAVAQICLTPNSLEEWAIEFQSLASEPLRLGNGVISDWTPNAPGITWHAVEEFVRPASDSKRRLSQMRAMARRFRGDDDFENEESVLRLLTNPLVRYANPEKRIIDGCLFSLVHGTDPEMLILIELRKSEEGKLIYYWALAPMTSFELRGYLDREEVWHKPKMTSNQPTDVFFQRLLSRPEPEEPPLRDRLRSLFGF